nr:hypothetical protein [Xanthomonas sp. LMG 9002]
MRDTPAEEIGERLAAHFFAVWEDAPSGHQLVALLRAAVSHADAKARITEIFETQLRTAVRRYLGPGAAAETRATLIASQMLGFALVRYVLEFPARGLTRPLAVRVLGETLQRYLTQPL